MEIRTLEVWSDFDTELPWLLRAGCKVCAGTEIFQRLCVALPRFHAAYRPEASYDVVFPGQTWEVRATYDPLLLICGERSLDCSRLRDTPSVVLAWPDFIPPDLAVLPGRTSAVPARPNVPPDLVVLSVAQELRVVTSVTELFSHFNWLTENTLAHPYISPLLCNYLMQTPADRDYAQKVENVWIYIFGRAIWVSPACSPWSLNCTCRSLRLQLPDTLTPVIPEPSASEMFRAPRHRLLTPLEATHD